MPEMCIGPKVRTKPIKSSQNCQLASRSEYIRPVDLGIPVIDAREQAHQDAADDHPVEMADDEVAVGELIIHGTTASMMPVKPPITNIDRKPSENSIGAAIRQRPP